MAKSVRFERTNLEKNSLQIMFDLMILAKEELSDLIVRLLPVLFFSQVQNCCITALLIVKLMVC